MQPLPCEETSDISNMNNSDAGTVGLQALPVKHALTLQLVNDSGKIDPHKKEKAMLPKSSSRRGGSRLQT